MQLQLDAEALQTQSCSCCASTIFTLQLVLTEQLEMNLTVFVQSVRCVFRFAGVSGPNHHLLALLSFPVCCQPSKPEQEIHEKVLMLSSKWFQDKNGNRMIFVPLFCGQILPVLNKTNFNPQNVTFLFLLLSVLSLGLSNQWSMSF